MTDDADKPVWIPPLRGHPLAKALLFITGFFGFYNAFWLTAAHVSDVASFPAESVLSVLAILLFPLGLNPVVGMYFLFRKNRWAAAMFFAATVAVFFVVIASGSVM